MENESKVSSSGAHFGGALAMMGGMFFLMGFFTWLNGPLLAFSRLTFDLDESGSFLILMAFYISYLVWPLPFARVLERIGFQNGISLGLIIMAIGAVAFAQFTAFRVYPGALAGLFVIGGGLALLQTAVNPYVSVLGPHESAARRMALMGICNKGAGILAPLLMGGLILSDIGTLESALKTAAPLDRNTMLDAYASRMQLPYIAMSLTLVIMAVAVHYAKLPAIEAEEGMDNQSSHWPSLKSDSRLWLGVMCIFLYVGAEVMAGDAIVAYGHELGLPTDATKFFTSLTLFGMLAGYLLGLVLIPRYMSQERYLTMSGLLGIILVLGATFSDGYVSVSFVAALGFANAMMWPAIFPLAIRGLGERTKIGSALLVMGICGGALVPQLYIVLKGFMPFQLAFAALLVPSYFYILWFGRVGTRSN
jgi:glucose/galactose transporter